MIKLDLGLRKIHEKQKDGELGSMASLHEILVGKGFRSTLKAGQPSARDAGVEIYEDPLGTKAIMQRIERGRPAMMTGAKVGLVRTHATPDVWQLLTGKKKKE